ncbi:hypothetical protein CTheo_3397 [Ceratobasidium theobromae]|uniref:Uncharacterized protein n=1 Tax=Ceratobasidium theobromae TaxID=1582974 RepID=A0A5N5QPI5_9AGAM|nr:hypothetical protein CTheo_3397 [Ceratobasidium theobromae]
MPRSLDGATGVVPHIIGDIIMRAIRAHCRAHLKLLPYFPNSTILTWPLRRALNLRFSGIAPPVTLMTSGVRVQRSMSLSGAGYTHEEIEGKLLKLYKRHTAILESDVALRKASFSVRSVALKIGITDAMVTLEALRNWYAEARNQWLLLQKECAKWVQNAPPPTQFPIGSAPCDMETADKSSSGISGPTGLGNGVGSCINEILDSNITCPGANNQALLTPPPSPASRSALVPRARRRKSEQASGVATRIPEEEGCQSESCPDEIACRRSQKRNAVVQRLCAFLEPENGVSYRAEVFATFFRRAIARSPSLFVRARTWETDNNIITPLRDGLGAQCTYELSARVVTDFIHSTALTQGELERLVKKLPFVRGESMSAELIRGAVADTFRSADLGAERTENCISLLGGWVFEKTWTKSMPLIAWDALHQMVGCAGCALGVSRALEEALLVRRFAYVGGCLEDAARLGVPIPPTLPEGAIPRFPRWQDQCSSPEVTMRILNVWLAADNRKTKRSELKKFNPKVHGMKPTYSEHEERYWLYMRMLRSNERVAPFVAALNASEKYTVLAQYNTKPKPTHVYAPAKEHDAWVSRVRSGTTPIARREARWTISTVFRMDIFEYFHKRSPEAKAGLTYLDEADILEVIVMDNRNGDWSPFLQSVGDVLLSVCGYSSLDAMLVGELSTSKGCL